MNLRSPCSLMLVVLSASLAADDQATRLDSPSKPGTDSSANQLSDTQSIGAPVTQSVTQIPKETILVKGESPSASDSVTPVPEGASIDQGVFRDPYLGLTYRLPEDWSEEYEGPPPSESGRCVIAQIGPSRTKEGPISASMLVTAQDMFFTPLPAANAVELTEYIKDHLQADYKLETPPTPIKLADRSFSFFAYWSPVAELH